MMITPILKFYAIFHRERGFLPQSKNGRGNSYSEFQHCGIPRLFKSRRAASVALVQWLRGTWVAKTSYDNWGSINDVYYEPKDIGRASQIPFIEIREVEIINLYAPQESKN